MAKSWIAKQYPLTATFSTHHGGPALTHTPQHLGLRGGELNHSLRVPTKGHVGLAVGGGAVAAYGGYKAYQHFQPKNTTQPQKALSRVRRKR